MSKSIFERLSAGRPSTTQEVHRTVSPTDKLLDWIMNFWTQDTLTHRDICALGPNSIRDRKKALDAAEALVKRGVLAPVKAHRRDSHEFKILWKTFPQTPTAV